MGRKIVFSVSWRWMIRLTALLLVLNVLDVASTVLCLSTGKLVELNVAAWNPLRLTIKFVVYFGFPLIYLFTHKFSKGIFDFLPFFGAIILSLICAGVVASNFANYWSVIF